MEKPLLNSFTINVALSQFIFSNAVFSCYVFVVLLTCSIFNSNRVMVHMWVRGERQVLTDLL